MDQKRKKMLLTGVLVLLALSAAFVLLLRDQREEILSALQGLTWTGVLCLLLMSGAYQLAESFICRTIVRTRIPDFPLFSAWKTVHLKVFGDVASFGTASLPLQMYFLHQNGLPAGAAMGQMTLEYIFHKGSILLYATVMLCAQWPWLMETARSVTVYLLPAYGICALIIASLVLVCMWPGLQRGALWLIRRLPESGKWPQRKAKLQEQIFFLREASRELFQNGPCCAKVLLLNGVKLFILFSTPWVCMTLLGMTAPSFAQTQMLSALMLLITSALPNVAGLGPTEFAFLLLFSPCVGSAQAALALVLYRVVTYYVPFLASMYAFCTIQRKSM